MTVVADTGPIISFARSGNEYLLRQIFSDILIPEAVYAEVVIKGRGKPGVSLVQGSPWIKRAAVHDSAKVNRLPKSLGLGEREAIILAKERNVSLLIDDRAARREAEKGGILCLGSLRVLKEAKDSGLITSVTPVVMALREAGLRLSNALYLDFLQQMGE
ncbi:MAG: DUF3368 domain-containing protein [Candidatus Omnitrophota bacterium]|jgi:predicted nucleic acid-binding protein|nr:MAG: DUF3368 domain-containing protein [Candidatus Omnitrophota bacterium]